MSKCLMVKTGKYVLSIGMEVHAELLTQTKMFCRCPNAFGGKPNSRVCPVCLGHPGVLPVPNRKAIELVLKTAIALHCVIPPRSVFYRKNYYYPDLPKGYQISQYGLTNPIGYSGYLDVPTESGEKRVRIRRVHLEEDTGKLFHLPTGGSGVDFNRAGVPLMEIVTEHPPDLHTPEEAQAYAYFLRLVLLYLGVCDGKMEQGSFRVEPNISLAPEGESTLGIKTELKNLGSFKAVLLGIRHEAERMRQALDRGETLRQETRGWDEERQESYVMRVKEY
ncbi:MAG: Asp-tRNA(Asn)/Glu-tRNA(Gln) amidotransferase subunit GatB, partial [Fimbriimonadales bacterium]|nr:Asp-tRNA(Asn)/Glu-tRNA(Gln) amidotransferase subunit GatB [Fimbriimonadales bacterium]